MLSNYYYDSQKYANSSLASNSMFSGNYCPQQFINLPPTTSIISGVISSDPLPDPNKMIPSNFSVPIYSKKSSEAVPAAFHASVDSQYQPIYCSSMMNNSNNMDPSFYYPILQNDVRPLSTSTTTTSSTNIPPAMYTQQLGIQNSSHDEQLQYYNLETSPFYLNDDDE